MSSGSAGYGSQDLGKTMRRNHTNRKEKSMAEVQQAFHAKEAKEAKKAAKKQTEETSDKAGSKEGQKSVGTPRHFGVKVYLTEEISRNV